MAPSLIGLLHGVVRQIGASDCEELGDGFLVQPINALSSFAYVVVGIVIAGVAWTRRRSPLESTVYALCLVGIGLGSVAFHGPQPAGSRIVHDLPILITVVFIVVHDARLLAPAFGRWTWPAFLGGSVVATVVTVVDQDAAGILTGVAVAAAIVEEFFIYRRRLRPDTLRRQRLTLASIVTLAVLAASTYVLGRTGSPACDPDGVFQFHGVWHLGSAVLFGLWWLLAFDVSSETRAPQPVQAEAAPN